MEAKLSESFFLEWIDTLGDFLNKRLDPKVVNIYYKRLQGLTNEEFLVAIENAIACAEQFKFPSADKLVEYALGTPEQRAQVKRSTHPADMPRLPGAPKPDYAPIALPGGGVIRPAGCPAGDNVREWQLGRLKCAVDTALFCRSFRTLDLIKQELSDSEGDAFRLGITWEDVQHGFHHESKREHSFQ